MPVLTTKIQVLGKLAIIIFSKQGQYNIFSHINKKNKNEFILLNLRWNYILEIVQRIQNRGNYTQSNNLDFNRWMDWLDSSYKFHYLKMDTVVKRSEKHYKILTKFIFPISCPTQKALSDHQKNYIIMLKDVDIWSGNKDLMQ